MKYFWVASTQKGKQKGQQQINFESRKIIKKTKFEIYKRTILRKIKKQS
jgi:hypothetical protein